MAIYRTKMINGLPPNKWAVELVADVGASEEFVKRMLEMHPLVDAGDIFEPQRQEVKSVSPQF